MKMKILRQAPGGYFQMTDGTWWLLNQQLGWVRANTEGRVFRYYIKEERG
jgi:hypothetical protein